MDSLYLALGLFFLYSFFGWLAEVAFSAVSRKKFVNTGFLTGPVCPIYGVGILFILPLLVNGGQSRYAKYHANQGFILFLANIVVGIASAILGKIPVLGAVLSALLSLASLALMIIGIINAANGKAKQLPLIGGLFHVFDK